MTQAPSPPVLVDLMIEPEWLIPINPQGVILQQQALLIDQGLIVDLLPASQARKKYRAKTHLPLPGEVVLPGLVNLHCHAAMTLMRGFADDLPLMRWLEEKIWPTEQAFVGPDFVHIGSLLACLEMIRGGITCFNDMYFYPEATAQAVLETGMRAALGMVVIDFPTRYANNLQDYLEKGASLHARYRTESRLSFCLAPHAPYTVSDNSLDAAREQAFDLAIPLHIHAHETTAEIAGDQARYGTRPLARLHAHGVLDKRTIIAHAVHLDDAEIELLAATKTNIAHCPTSNLKLGSGIADSAKWLSHGISFGLGTDGAASNNRLDIWQEMRQAALLAKAKTGDAGVFNAHQALYAGTLGGATALGLDQHIGSLEPGKSADFIAVTLDDWSTQPCFDPTSHLVHVCGREQVTHTWVQGKLLQQHGIPTYTDLLTLKAKTAEWRSRLTQNASPTSINSR